MRVYFRIQWKILNRHIAEAGISTILAWALIALTFVGGSVFLFANYKYAQYAYLMPPVFFCGRLSEFKRREFLKTCYGVNQSTKIRLIENLIISVPFMVFLAVFQHFLVVFLLVFIVSVLSYSEIKGNFRFVMPTPFQKKPFEFVIGFRSSFYIIFLTIALSIIAAVVDNLNLGLFGLAVGFLTTLSYYSRVEDLTYVWAHSKTPERFLFEKIKTALWFNILLHLPTTLILSYFFFDNIFIILVLWGVASLSILYAIVIKYASFPKQLGVKEAVIISICVMFPPLIIVAVPFYYFQSLKSLSKVLR